MHRVVVAKVDRLTRSVAFLSRPLERQASTCASPICRRSRGPTGRFMLQQMAAVAELEAGMISKRTRDALAAAKRRGKKLGGDRGARLSATARAAGRGCGGARCGEGSRFRAHHRRATGERRDDAAGDC